MRERIGVALILIVSEKESLTYNLLTDLESVFVSRTTHRVCSGDEKSYIWMNAELIVSKC